MSKIIYRINGFVNSDLVDWIVSQVGFISILQQDTYSVVARFNHDSTQQDTFRKALSDRLNVTGNPDDYIVNDILFTDAVLYTSEFTITKTDVGSTYVDLFTDFNGRPFVVDTTGYSKVAVQTLWNKNAGVGTHFIRIVNHANTAQVLYENTNLANGENFDGNVIIPSLFVNFKGKLRIQVKTSNATDDPIFSSIRVYLRR